MKILNKLTIKHLTMNKKRTIVTIIGVILSTALMVGIGLLFASLRDNTIKTTIVSSGKQHLIIEGVEAKKIKLLNNNVEVEESYYEKPLGYAKVDSSNENKPYVLVMEASNGFLEQLKLTTGRLPQNGEEIVISEHMKSNGQINYKVGDTLTVDIGSRKFVNNLGLETITLDREAYRKEETLQITGRKTYKVVGKSERSFIEEYSSPGYMVFTKSTNIESKTLVNTYITFKSVKDVYKKGKIIGQNLGISKDNLKSDLSFNDSLLATYGVSKYTNVFSSMTGIILIILTLISVGCIVVIYNSFAISVMERKKQFGLFSSIGATRKQLRHTVFFEAIIVGVIGIPLGVIGAVGGIWTVLTIVNQMLPNIFQFPLALSVYPVYILIPVIFMIVVILFSSFLPARKASKITPIEAIRQNDDIKIKGKKLKTSKWVHKLFGIEGEIALKNIKRNKRKYRITIVSLFISIVLFISFSSLMNYGITASNDIIENPDYDISIDINSKDPTKVKGLFETLRQNEEVEEITFSQSIFMATDDLIPYYSQTAKDVFTNIQGRDIKAEGVYVTTLDSKNYKKALAENHLTDKDTMVLNQTKNIVYKREERRVEKYDILKDSLKEIPLYKVESVKSENKSGTQQNQIVKTKIYTLDRLKNIVKTPFAMEYSTNVYTPNVIVSEKIYNEILMKHSEKKGSDIQNIYIKAPKYKKLDAYLEEIDMSGAYETFYYTNITENMKLEKNMLFVFSLLLYGFITLVTLIGVTSVFNTINTSIALRRKEFAMLRSMGLTPRGFNKILYFESIFFGLKSLLYAIPVSLVITALIAIQISNIVTIDNFLIPLQSVIIATIGVFGIVLMTMMYASSKIKKENILEAIREENI